ncbi:hypothetical protein M758_7G109400 [Ceratodon purpureus]|uniref:Secreted protein n=1 Tax=Ceratodon purpureus TaxID=3225 RepID=A0A8T0HC23_CERPU|nr:hypothetical protein KC19_7G166900 [Ceratodon purpureus]KAG0611034.1 hypothetical protein M758_7G109400 [Ceratodon purpureus]
MATFWFSRLSYLCTAILPQPDDPTITTIAQIHHTTRSELPLSIPVPDLSRPHTTAEFRNSATTAAITIDSHWIV